jgi:chemotaxis family two-component system response regulator Rcp1
MNGNSERHSGIRVLLVDDNPGDVRLTMEAWKDAKVLVDMHVVMDGVEAIQFLRRQGQFAASPRPDLILLDLNLPRKDGREVLHEIKSDPLLKSIPVVILTTSASQIDIERSYLLHANCYISKPVDLEGFLKVVATIEDFWLTVVRLPSMPSVVPSEASSQVPSHATSQVPSQASAPIAGPGVQS